MSFFKTIFIIGLFVVLPGSTFSRNKLIFKSDSLFMGMIFDKSDNKPLPYVNVGIIGKSVGTVSNAKAEFQLDLAGTSLNDTVKFSMIGYLPLKLPVKEIRDISSSRIFYLSRNSIMLDDVYVVSKKSMVKIEGRKSSGGVLQATFNSKKNELSAKLGTEIGMRMNYSKSQPALVKDFNWYFSSNNFTFLKFRINIYSIKNNLPDSLLSKSEIYVDVSDSKTGWNKVDLAPYNLYINSDFIISLQWVESRTNNSMAPKVWIPGSLSPFGSIYFRNASQDQWHKTAAKISYYVTLLY